MIKKDATMFWPVLYEIPTSHEYNSIACHRNKYTKGSSEEYTLSFVCQSGQMRIDRVKPMSISIYSIMENPSMGHIFDQQFRIKISRGGFVSVHRMTNRSQEPSNLARVEARLVYGGSPCGSNTSSCSLSA